MTDVEPAAPPVISVMLIVPSADAATAWYQAALGATELWNLGSVVGLEIAGAPFFLHEINPANPAETSPGQAGVTSTRVELFTDDPDHVIERAIAAGATAGRPSRITACPGGRTGKVASPIPSATGGRSATARLWAGSEADRRAVAASD